MPGWCDNVAMGKKISVEDVLGRGLRRLNNRLYLSGTLFLDGDSDYRAGGEGEA